MKDPARLALGAAVSIVAHGLLFLPAGPAKADLPGAVATSQSLEVVALDPERVKEILQPSVRPAAPCLAGAASPPAPRALPEWPTWSLERPAESPDPDPPRLLVLPWIDAERISSGAATELLRPLVDLPMVDVAPSLSVVASEPTAPPRLEDLTGLVVYQEPLDYPLQAVRRHVEGIVSIAVQVDAEGRVEDARVLRSSGNRLLDRAARENLLRWRFDPAAVEAARLGSVFRQDVSFEIE